MDNGAIIGRFAPTPSGPLHFGSLVTALASYCHSKSQQGQWLIRVEDVDTPRVVKGSGKQILKALEDFGFEWDGDVEYQSHYFDCYRQTLDKLLTRKIAYGCECSRRSLREAGAKQGPLGLIYPGICRHKNLNPDRHSIRIKTSSEKSSETSVGFIDQVYGNVDFDINAQLGDFILRRADGIYAYHLAVVVDDQRQGINQIVRGADLLEATCLHLYLQQLLGFNRPQYAHIPLVRNQAGDKLSKQTGASAIEANNKVDLLINALQTLGQPVEADMQQGSVTEILQAAIKSWDLNHIAVPRGSYY